MKTQKTWIGLLAFYLNVQEAMCIVWQANIYIATLDVLRTQ
jgi:hypothetical protein